jgi:RND family efflux transporter MFP subunit
MTLVAAPSKSKSRRRWLPFAVATVVALGAMGAFALVSTFRGGSSAAGAGGKFYAVAPIDLEVKVVKDGELAAVNNIDILNQVEGLSTIVQIVKEGAYAKKGDVLVELDSSEIRQKIDDATLELQKADADLIVAKEMRSIQESQNSADLEAAEVQVELARLGLKQYVEGTYVQELADAQTAVKMADTTVKNKQDDLEQTQSLYGKGFVTGAAVKQDELELIEAKNAQSSSRMKLKVLKEYSYPSALAEAKSKLVQAEQALERVKKRNASQLSSVISTEKAAEQTLVMKKRKLDHLKEQLALCVIKAPADGLVVYAGDRNYSQSQVAEGAQVRERQQILRLPDTAQMKAVVRINEAQVPKLRLGQKASVEIVGLPAPVSATLTKISPLADSGSRWWNPDLKEYPVELTLDATPAEVKPGIGVKAEIFTDRLNDVLAVPLAAVYSDKASTFVFVREAESGELKPLPVKIGETNETHARIATGLKPGDSVLLLQAGQGRELLERAGISTGERDVKQAPPDGAKPQVAETAVASTPAAGVAPVVPAAAPAAGAAPGAAAAIAAPGAAEAVAKPAAPRVNRRRDRAPRDSGGEGTPGGDSSASPADNTKSAPAAAAPKPAPAAVTRIDTAE